MKAALKSLVDHYDRPDVLAFYSVLEDDFVSREGIYPNLDFPSGPAYRLIGFDTPAFTPIFVAARVTGWAAHILELASANALIRALSKNGTDERRATSDVPGRGWRRGCTSGTTGSWLFGPLARHRLRSTRAATFWGPYGRPW